MQLKDFIELHEIDPTKVLLLRHTFPRANSSSKAKFTSIVADQEDLFNAYQQGQKKEVGDKMRMATHVASFFGHEPKKAVFVGLYTKLGCEEISNENYWRIPACAELKALGMQGFDGGDGRSSLLWFNLALDRSFHAELKGRMVIDWPGVEINWHRWASDIDTPVIKIMRYNVLKETKNGSSQENDAYIPYEVEKEPKESELPVIRTINGTEFIRSETVAAHVKRLAHGLCDLCRRPAPFETIEGPFLECHHVVHLARGGRDAVENAVALCPNCHRRMHALDDADDVKRLQRRIGERE